MSRLDLDLIVRRTGWSPWLAAAMLVAAVALHVMGTGQVQSAVVAQHAELARLRSLEAVPRAALRPEKPLLETRFDAFIATLGDKRDLNRYVATVFAHAKKHDIALAQAEYKLDFVKQGGFYTYQATLPVRGTYPQLRRFIDATLQSVPCAALEDVDFKRDQIGAPTTEAKLRFVFYLKDAQ